MSQVIHDEKQPAMQQSPRIRKMIALLLRHEQRLDACVSGHLELHFYRSEGDEEVKAKLVEHLRND